jgi:YidC/Oxa1 family membrane protein insertase
MQQKNLFIFLFLCLVILIGWPMLMRVLFQRPATEQTKAHLPPESVRRDLLAHLSAVPLPGGSGIPPALAAVGSQLPWRPPEPSATQAWALLPAVQRENLRVLGGAFLSPLNVDAFLLEQHQRAVVQAKPEPEPKTHLLGGGPEDNIAVKLTDKGAGVQELILTKFRAATREGRPGGPVLPLIPDDPVRGSFLMYHYPEPDKEGSRPLDTLGLKVWTYHDKESSASKAVFSTTVDGLVITKTYELKPRTYHLTLTLAFERPGQPETRAEPVPFRYQLVGPHGMPIEGEWYTSIFRNPVMTFVDARKNAWRYDIEEGETQYRVSFRKGGERFPEGPLAEGDYIQYGGVAIQYFASLIVVDNLQPPREQGGVDYKGILAYLRPTLESEEIRGQLIQMGGDQFLLQPKLETGDKEFLKLRGPVAFRLLPRAQEELAEESIEPGAAVVVNYYRLFDGQLVAEHVRRGTTVRPFTEDITVRAVSKVLSLKPGEKVVHQFMLYNGPSKVALLGQFTGDKAVDPSLVARYASDLHLNTLTDYRSAGPVSSFFSKIGWTSLLIACTSLMHWLLNLLHLIVGNWGLSIIFLTVLVRGLMFPISRKQAALSVRMQELAPEMKKIQEKYKSDPRARQQAQMELYRRHKVNPLGGCLPVLLQMPIFLGLYYCLQESIHFRLANFLWIQNLAAPDMLLWWGNHIPLISDPDNQSGSMVSFLYLGPFLNVLPIIAVGFMIMQQKMLTPPPQDEQQAQQQKLMKYMMVFFGVMFYKVAAGLCLYFIASSLWGLAERRLVPRKATATTAAGAPPPSKADGKKSLNGSPGGRKGKPGKKEKPAPVDGPMQKVKDWWAEVLKQARKK